MMFLFQTVLLCQSDSDRDSDEENISEDRSSDKLSWTHSMHSISSLNSAVVRIFDSAFIHEVQYRFYCPSKLCDCEMRHVGTVVIIKFRICCTTGRSSSAYPVSTAFDSSRGSSVCHQHVLQAKQVSTLHVDYGRP